MKHLYKLLLLLLMFSCEEQTAIPSGDKVAAPEPDEIPEETLPTVIVGYMTYWDTTMPDPSLLTHINYAFAHIKNDFESLDIKKETRLAKVAALKNDHPHLKIMLSVGGWGAGNFSEMAADATHRRKFCENCLAVVQKYDLAGIDLDWEYPTSDSGGISSSPDDTKNFNLLLQDMREVLGPNLLITMASSSSAKYVDFKTAIQYLDFVNIMTYDMGDPPQHNAGLYPSDMTRRSCDESVDFHRQKGVPYNKIVLGMPFYGHGNGKDFEDSVDYKDIKYDGYTEKWDDVAMVPYLVNSEGKMVLTYDNERSIGLKADYIKSKKLRGAMYWNLEADDKDWTLSKAIHTRLFPAAE